MHSKVEYCYVLLDGEVEYFLVDEVSDEETTLFSTTKGGLVIGWEVLNQPERFLTNVRVISEKASLLKIQKDDFLTDLSTNGLMDLCGSLYHLLELSMHQQTALLSNVVRQRAIQIDNYFISQESTLEERTQLLKGSPFFGEFSEEDIQHLAGAMERREYEANELIYDQGEDTKGIFVLIYGEVSIRWEAGEVYLDLRSISTPGYIFGWSSAFASADLFRATTEHKTSVYFISNEKLKPLIHSTPFGIDFFRMVVWLMSNQLQLSYSRYVHLLDDHQLVSVKHLIDINRPRIPLPSPLHQIPHLLQDISTKSLAFSILHALHDKGTQQERHLSSICLDLLKSEEKEMLFLQRIADVYKVVSKGSLENSATNRSQCAEKTREAFKYVPFHLVGLENLPKEPGHIFIYNHLVNHPRYTLNNKFQLTLDSHFLSGLILDKHYGDPGMRTVRYGKSNEYGHQDYYDKLGYINVYTKDSDLQDEQSKYEAKERFYREAGDYLNDGVNFIISPEGTSFSSEESPGPFKMGPFNLAMKAEKEPLIVPVVFINFDKRITEKIFYCKILEPFRISERKEEHQPLKEFVEGYQEAFANSVEIARLEAERLFIQINRQ